MGHTLLCVLGFFFLNLLLYGHAEGQDDEQERSAEDSGVGTGPTDGDAILEIPSSTVFEGDSVTLRCRQRTPGHETKATFIKDGSALEMDTNHQSVSVVEMTINPVSVSDGGTYTCKFDDGAESAARKLKVEVPNRVVVTLQPNWPQIFSGEKISVRCEIQDGGDTDWTYEWTPAELNTPPTFSEYRISSATESHSGDYRCKGRRDYFLTRWSDAITLTVSSHRPKAQLRKEKTAIPAGGSVTLTCSVKPPSSGWKYFWYRGEKTSEPLSTQDAVFLSTEQIRVSQGGLYWCRGGRGEPVYYTEYSDAVVTNRAVVTLQPNWPEVYYGETVTLRCEIEDGGDTEWEYLWSTTSSGTFPKHSEYGVISATIYSGGDYYCMGRHKTDSTEWSSPIRLTVLAHTPKAELRADDRVIPAGGSVTLTCSVNPPSSGWKYFWYRGEKTSEPLSTQDAVFLSTEQIRVSQGGLYWCRGGRGEPVYYTEYSDAVGINKIIENKAAVTLEPNWSEIYYGETITLRCEIKDGGNTEWDYEWRPSSYIHQKQNEYRISSASAYHSGAYSCKGRMKSAQDSLTDWSDPIKLTVSGKPQPVLTVSPSWLSPGDSVTLNCSVEDPSAGWRFYWYKAVPKLPDNSYSYELLPGSSNGTEEDSYIVHGQTHTAGYVCRAGRGDPVFYTLYSEPKFVWSGDFHSSASLTVSPDRVQHFTSESVTLNCEGNSTEWRVKRFPEDDNLLYSSCHSTWRTMTGSTCSIYRYRQSDAVYWCESGSGEFSNAVNITKQNEDIILVSPVHPVTEGDSVSLSCKWKIRRLTSNVFFYQNDKLIQNDTRRELNISAVSKSDEGFYKCQHSGKVSSQSWMSVKGVSRPERASFPVPLIVGLVCGIVLIIALLLLYCCRQSKGSSFIRPVQSESTNQDSATNDVVNQNEAQCNEYSSPVHGNTCLYETIKGSADIENVADVTYSLIELKNTGRKGKQREPEESSVYADVKMGTADDNLMYAQVNCHNKGKAKKTKGKSTPAATDETLYSEVKPRTALGNNAPI